jgi:Ca2+-binding RTX toxin-like protein
MPIFSIPSLIPTQGTPRGPGQTVPSLPSFVGTDSDDTFQIGSFGTLPVPGTAPISISGGLGANDYVDFSSFSPGTSGAGIVVEAGMSELSLRPGATSPVIAVLSGIERLSGSAFSDDITVGFSLRDVFAGGGNDVVRGNAAGGATLDGGAGKDILAYLDDSSTAPRHMMISLDSGWAMDRAGHADHIVDFEQIITGRGDDFIAGNSVDNAVSSGAGADVMLGGRGSDWLDGGDGNDILIGSDFAPDGAVVDFDMLFGGNGNDFLMVGNGAAAMLAGGAGNDSIWGGSRADTIMLGSGKDFAGGLGGVDRFTFTEAMQAGDFSYIADFADNAWSAEGDMLVFAEAMRGNVTVQDLAGGAYVSVSVAGGAYGIMLAGMTAAGLADQIDFII